ncbi:MAG: SDR family oxidoreductase [Ignavibacteria bacterium]|nr:SDR family oxidoreductase [Ignavibacteria bacterium]
MPEPDTIRKHIWITGASRGIGLSIAKALSSTCNLTLSARNEASLKQVERLLPKQTSQTLVCDVADAASLARSHAIAEKVFGPVNVLINSAGLGIWKSLVDMSEGEFVDMQKINLTGGFLSAKTVLPSMIEHNNGMIITINSIAAITAYEGNGGYGSSKAGLLAMNRVLRNEVRDHGIKVTDIILGATSTEMWDLQEIDELGSKMMLADDVADVVAFLVSNLDNPRTHIEEIIMRPQNGDL